MLHRLEPVVCATPWSRSPPTDCCSPRTATGTRTSPRCSSGSRRSTTPRQRLCLHLDRHPPGRPHQRRHDLPSLVDVGRRDGRQRARGRDRQRSRLHDRALRRSGSARHGPAAPGSRAVGQRPRGCVGHGRTARAARAGRGVQLRAAGFHVRQQLSDGRSGRGSGARDGWPPLGDRGGSRRGRSISNGLTIAGFAESTAIAVAEWITAVCPPRARTELLAGRAEGPAELMAALRATGTGRPPVVAGQRRARRALRARRRYPGVEPDHGLVGERSAGRPALGHGHVGALHLALQAGRVGHPVDVGADADEPLRPGHRLVAPRTAAPDDDGRPAGPAAPLPPCPRPHRRPEWIAAPPASAERRSPWQIGWRRVAGGR